MIPTNGRLKAHLPLTSGLFCRYCGVAQASGYARCLDGMSHDWERDTASEPASEAENDEDTLIAVYDSVPIPGALGHRESLRAVAAHVRAEMQKEVLQDYSMGFKHGYEQALATTTGKP